MRLLLATHNRKKLAELSRILGPLSGGFELLSLDDLPAYDEPAETESTFSGNALLKARAAFTHARSSGPAPTGDEARPFDPESALASVAEGGLASVADDSGLCIDALNGMPGVLSARWAGRARVDRASADAANLELVLEQLHDVPDERRGAAFECRIALVLPDGNEHVVEGRLPGRIDRSPRGSNGFGYDPIFVPDGHDRSLAELDADAKDAISHRGRALRALVEVLADLPK